MILLYVVQVHYVSTLPPIIVPSSCSSSHRKSLVDLPAQPNRLCSEEVDLYIRTERTRAQTPIKEVISDVDNPVSGVYSKVIVQERRDCYMDERRHNVQEERAPVCLFF